MGEVNEVKKSGKGWIIGIIIALIAVAVFMVVTIMNRAKGEVPFDYDLSEYVEVGEYKDLPFYTAETKVTEEEVQTEIDTILEYATEVETILDGKVEDGDTINIAFVGKIDGEEFEGGTSDSFDLTVGTTSMIEGFVEGLVGKKIGETVTLDLKFPENYGVEELNGKPVVFDVTINNKRVSTVPELTDDFVKENTDFETIEELRADIESYIKRTKESQAKSDIQGKIWQKIAEDSNVIKEPEKERQVLVDDAEAIETSYREQAESYSMEWPDFLSMFMGTDEEGFQQIKEEYIASSLKDQLITYAIARAEKINFTAKEFDNELAKLLEESGYTEETFQQDYGMTVKEYAQQNNWEFSMLREKVMEKIMSYGKEVSEDEFNEFYGEDEEVVIPEDEDLLQVEDTDLQVEIEETDGEADGEAEEAEETEEGNN